MSVVFKARRELLRFVGWFFLINVFLSFVIGVSYVNTVPDFHAAVGPSFFSVTLGWLFLIASFIAQMGILFFIFAGLVMIVVWLLPHRRLVLVLSVVFCALLLFGLIADRIAYSIYHMHYAGVGLEIIKAGALLQVIPLSAHEKLLIMLLLLILFAMEMLIARFLWRYISRQASKKSGYVFAGSFALAIFLSYGIHFLALQPDGVLNLTQSHHVLEAARLVPYYDEVYAFIMSHHVDTRRVTTSQGLVNFQLHALNQPLKYPLHALQCKKSMHPLNILVIGIDTWRYDAMTPKISPNIYQFSQKTLQFQDQWSGGNCTEPGLFSLFYGIPANYWQAARQQHRGPELIRELQKQNYQLAIFTSAPLNFPAFDKTIFQDVKDLNIRTPGINTVKRDENITEEFQNFLQVRDKKRAFFSFLFYDSAHNYCEVNPKDQPFQPAIKSCDRFSLTSSVDPTPYVNRYHNAVHFVDSQVQRVLSGLEQQGLLSNTIVIITADHGEEINDNNSGYWEHASAYDEYQLHVPMLVYWPGKSPKIYSYFTTHYDVVPTLMQDVLGCQNQLADYTIGRSLFLPGNRSELVAGSYADYAIVTKGGATRIYPGGDYVVDDSQGRHLNQAVLEKEALARAFGYLHQYFQP